MMNRNYYLVEAMCGHVGSGNYIPILFPITAENGKEAARIARDIPRVKHHHKYAILNVEKVSEERYLNQKEINECDPYLHHSDYEHDEKYSDMLLERTKHMSFISPIKKKKKDYNKHHNLDYRRSCTMNVYAYDC